MWNNSSVLPLEYDLNRIDESWLLYLGPLVITYVLNPIFIVHCLILEKEEIEYHIIS